MHKRIFLIGATRSGTTLMQSRLSDAGNIASFPETGYFGSLFGLIRQRTYGKGKLTEADILKAAFRKYLGVAYPRSKYALGAVRQLANHLGIDEQRFHSRFMVRGAVDDLLTLLDGEAIRLGADAWLEKSPVHTYYLPEIEHYIPDALFVHIIRPGKDVVASNIDAARKYEGGDHSFKDDLEKCINRWNNAMRCQFMHLGKPNHFFVYYDSFIAQPERAIHEIFRFLRLNNKNNTAAESGAAYNRIFSEEERWKQGVKSAIKPPENKFETILTTAEQAQVVDALIDISHFLQLRQANVFNPAALNA